MLSPPAPATDGDGHRGDRQREAPPAIDHDRAAATGRRHRLIADIDRVRALAAARHDDLDWREVTGLLTQLRANLSHDLDHRPLP